MVSEAPMYLEILFRSILQAIVSLAPFLGLAAIAWVILSVSKPAHLFNEFPLFCRHLHGRASIRRTARLSPQPNPA
jgi:hypothetical protein